MSINKTAIFALAGAVIAAPAFAGSLPAKKPAAPTAQGAATAAATSEGLKPCITPAEKKGFILPGSETCFVLSGYVWFEGVATPKDTYDTVKSGAYGNKFYSKYRVALNLDANSNTEMGLLRSYVSILSDQAPNYNRDSNNNLNPTYVDQAYIQLGGLTAGYLNSTFNSFVGGSDRLEAKRLTSDWKPNQISYQMSLGGGLKVGAAVETAQSLDATAVSSSSGSVTASTFNGNVNPDIVATADYSSGDITVHLGGALHDASNSTRTRTGYGVDAGVRIGLPQLGSGDFLQIEGSYAYAAGNRLNNNTMDFSGKFGDVPYQTTYGADNFVAGGVSYAIRGYNIGAQLKHNWSSQFFTTLRGGYLTNEPDGYTAKDYSFNAKFASVSFGYVPVKNLKVVFEPSWYRYSRYDDLALNGDNAAKAGDQFQYVLRVQRDF